MTKKEEGYNGWTNYPTWCVNLWFQNEEGLYYLAQEMAQLAYANAEADGIFSREEAARIALAEEIKQWVYEQMPEQLSNASMLADLMGWAVESADYHEIAENWISEIEEDSIVP